MATIKFDDHRPFPKGYPRVRIAKDMEVSSPLGVELHAGQMLDFDVRAIVEVVDGRFAITEMTLRSVGGGPPISASQIAKLRIWDFIHSAIYVSNSMVYITQSFPELSDRVFVSEATASEAWQQQLTALLELESARNDLKALTRFYRITRLGHYDPTETVARSLGVSASTVRRWLGEAVAAGELSQTERKK
jgi:hypothetical protein